MTAAPASPLRAAVAAIVVVVVAGCAALRATAPGNAAGRARIASAPLTATPGDPARGRLIVLAPDRGNCSLCHALPDPAQKFHGDIGPSLAGVGARLTPAELRTRIIDASLLNPDTLMPPFHRTTGLRRVDAAHRGKPILDAQEVEDVVAYLATLR